MSTEKFDLIISDVLIFDGTNTSPFRGSLGITNGIIQEIAKEKKINGDTVHSIASSDLSENYQQVAVCPGFIDMHSHSDLAPLMRKDEKKAIASFSKLSQGITTELVGQDGFSAAPIRNEMKKEYIDHWSALTGYLPESEWKWNSVKEYLEIVNENSETKIETLVGHSTLRINVIGFDSREPSSEELNEMKELLRTSMKDGAKGLSLGLIYPPGMFAKEEEIIELAKVVAEFAGIVVAHIRNESEQILIAADEYLRITQAAHCKTHFSHFKVCGRDKEEKANKLVEKLSSAEEKGLPISFDMYPYDAGSTTLQAILPPWVQEGTPKDVISRLSSPVLVQKMARDIFDFTNTNWENFIAISEGGLEGIMISDAPESHKFLIGKSLLDIGRDTGYDVLTDHGKVQTFELIAKYLVETNLGLAMISHNQSMAIVNKFLRLKEWMTLGTDGVIGKKPHPRLYSTMTRFLRLVREDQSYLIQGAISQITSKPSQLLQLSKRGTLQVGQSADLIIFNYEEIGESNSYIEPLEPSKGIYETVVSGKRSYKDICKP